MSHEVLSLTIDQICYPTSEIRVVHSRSREELRPIQFLAWNSVKVTAQVLMVNSETQHLSPRVPWHVAHTPWTGCRWQQQSFYLTISTWFAQHGPGDVISLGGGNVVENTENHCINFLKPCPGLGCPVMPQCRLCSPHHIVHTPLRYNRTLLALFITENTQVARSQSV